MAELVLCQPRVGEWDAMRSSPALPLSLLHAASLAVSEFNVQIIDQRVDSRWKESLKAAIGPDTLAVGFTSYTGPMILSSLEMAAEARKFTTAPFIWGGIHPTLDSETTISHPLVDIVARGEGEETLVEVARALKTRRSLDGIAGCWFKEGGEIRRNPDRDLLDVETLPEIPYHLVDVQRYMPRYRGRKSLFLQSSRGCPYACAYCFNPRFNRKVFRQQSAERVLARVRYMVEKFGAEDIFFVDDNFLVDLKRDRALIEGMKKIGVTWQIQGADMAALRRMDDEFLSLIEQSGLQRITLGIESGSPRIRKNMLKAGSVEDVELVVRRLTKLKMDVYAGFIVGLPGETEEEMKQTVALVLKLTRLNPNLHNSPLYNYSPYPGTKAFDMAVELGLKPPKSLEEWGRVGGWDVFSWQNRPGAKMFESLYFVSNFLDRKTEGYTVPAIVTLMTDLYRPIARWRVKHLNFNFLIEKPLIEWAQRRLEQRIAREVAGGKSG